jgi:hypothetical protein
VVKARVLKNAEELIGEYGGGDGRTLDLPTVYYLSMLGCLLQSSSHPKNQSFYVKVQETYRYIATFLC